MKASDLFVRALEAEGVEWIFGIPGEENLDLLESLRTSKIKLILTRHEQGAGFMAATVGRLTGKTGAASWCSAPVRWTPRPLLSNWGPSMCLISCTSRTTGLSSN